MSTINYSDLRASLKDVMDRAVENHEEVIITRRNGGDVVMLSMEDWRAIQETLYLTSTPNNAKRLIESIDELDCGSGIEVAVDK